MRRLSLITMAAYAALAFASAAYAQQPPAAAPPPPPPPAYGPPVTLEQAKKAVAASVTEAKKAAGYLFVFAVVDPAGNLVYFEKMDSAPTSSVDIAIGKAWTAATFKRPSKLYFDLMEAGHSFFGTLHPRLTASAGGVPIMVDGKIVGAIGVSGGASGLMDLGAAQAGADALK
jgi:glc operon protein GlcG